MPRALSTLLLASLAAGFAAADIPPPPPPKGKKDVNVTSEVKLGKDVKGYVFVLQRFTDAADRKATTTRLELSADKAATVTTGGRRNFATLYAVPADAAKEYKTDQELFDAVVAKKVKGVESMTFGGSAVVGDAVKVASVTWTYTVTGIDDKGIKTDVTGDGSEGDRKGEEKPFALFDEPGYLIGGIAAALAVTLGGVWLVRRKNVGRPGGRPFGPPTPSSAPPPSRAGGPPGR